MCTGWLFQIRSGTLFLFRTDRSSNTLHCRCGVASASAARSAVSPNSLLLLKTGNAAVARRNVAADIAVAHALDFSLVDLKPEASSGCDLAGLSRTRYGVARCNAGREPLPSDELDQAAVHPCGSEQIALRAGLTRGDESRNIECQFTRSPKPELAAGQSKSLGNEIGVDAFATHA